MDAHAGAPPLDPVLAGESKAVIEVRCHVCDHAIEGEPAGHGVLVFPRGDRVEREDQPLCSTCALAIGIAAHWRFAEEEEEG